MANEQGFIVSLDLTGVEYNVGFERVPDGIYEVVMVSAKPHISKDALSKNPGQTTATSIHFTAQVFAPAALRGVLLSCYAGLDMSSDGVKSQWKAICLSLGMKEDKLNSGKKIDFDTVKTIKTKEGQSRHAYMLVKNPQRGPQDTRDPLPDVSFISPEHYTRLKDVKFTSPTPAPAPAGATALNQNGTPVGKGGGTFAVEQSPSPQVQQQAVQQAQPVVQQQASTPPQVQNGSTSTIVPPAQAAGTEAGADDGF